MKYTNKYELIIPWLLTSGIKIVFIIIGSLILNKVIVTFYRKAVRIAVRPDGISSKDAEEKKENTLIKFLPLANNCTIITGLMVLQRIWSR
jgi:small conductance mechanosensitive channel